MVWDERDIKEYSGLELRVCSEAPVPHSQRSWCSSRSFSLRAVDAAIPIPDFWLFSRSSLLAGQAQSEPCRALQSCEFRCCTRGERKHQINSSEQHKRHVKLNHRFLFVLEQDRNIFPLLNGSFIQSNISERVGVFFVFFFLQHKIQANLVMSQAGFCQVLSEHL